MNINKELDLIMDKYNLGGLKYLRESIREIIQNELEKAVRLYGNKIVIRGIKYREDGDYSLCALAEQCGDITAVVDQNAFSDKLHLPSGKEIPFHETDWKPSKDICDIYLINAIKKGQDIYCQEQKQLGDEGIYVMDLYRMIRMKYSIPLDKVKAFDELTEEIDYTHNRIWLARERFLQDRSWKNFQELLGECLALRDFVSFFKYANEEKDMINQRETLRKLKEDIEAFLNTIKEEFAKKKEHQEYRDIIVHWIDQVSYEERMLLPGVEKKLENGLLFQNAYTHTPYTRPTVRMIFWKQFREENAAGTPGGYDKRNLKDSGLYNRIQDAGYELEIFGYLKQILDKDADNCFAATTASGVLYFQMLNALLNSEKPVFSMVHILNETHEPYMSPEAGVENTSFEFSDSYESAAERITISAAYMDELIDFYDSLLGEQVINIYMSDHGKWEDIDRRRYKDEAMHTILGITNIGVRGTVERLFPYRDFDKLVGWVLEMAGPEEMFFDDLPIYTKHLRIGIMERKGDTEEICTGYIGINTRTDKYICLDNEKEYYLLKKDGETENHMDDRKYVERISRLRMRCLQLRDAMLGKNTR